MSRARTAHPIGTPAETLAPFGPRSTTNASARRWLAVAAGGAAAGVAIALVSQHRFGLQPCPWCVLQRLIFLAFALVATLGALGHSRLLHRFSAGIGLMLVLAGAAAALWQHFQAAASASCSMTFADKIISRTLELDSLLPAVFEPRASCADAAVNLLGVPYDFWSLGLFVALGLMMLRVLHRSPGR